MKDFEWRSASVAFSDVHIKLEKKKKYKNPNEMNMFRPLLLLDINTRFDQFDAKFGTQKNQQEQMQQAVS